VVGPRPRTFAEHGLVTPTTNRAARGVPGAAITSIEGGPDRRLRARARTRPLVRTKQRKRSVLRRPQESKAPVLQDTVATPPIDPPRLHARAAKTRTRSTVRELTRLRDEPLESPGASNLHRGPSSTRPNTIASNQPCRVPRGRSSCESWSPFDDHSRMLLLRGANQPAGRSMRSRVEPTGSMHHAIASVPGGEDHVLKSGSRTRLRRSYRWHPSMSRQRGVIHR
jgi:hypothetical protein